MSYESWSCVSKDGGYRLIVEKSKEKLSLSIKDSRNACLWMELSLENGKRLIEFLTADSTESKGCNCQVGEMEEQRLQREVDQEARERGETGNLQEQIDTLSNDVQEEDNVINRIKDLLDLNSITTGIA